MKLIVCADDNWGIGKDNQLIYHSKKDMAFFKCSTMNKVVIMGKNTCLSLPKKKLPKRINMILSTTMHQPDDVDVFVYNSIDDIFQELIKSGKVNLAYVIGGQSIYELFLPYCTDAYVTHIIGSKPADTFFPNLDENSDWEKTIQGPIIEEGELKMEYLEYHNNNCKFPGPYGC